jgi:hypothetical protein
MTDTSLLRQHLKDIKKRAESASDEEKGILRMQYAYTKRSIEIIESIPDEKRSDPQLEVIRKSLF